MQFSMQLSCNQPQFTAFGLFSIDGSLIYAVKYYISLQMGNQTINILFKIAGATTTYLVILVQFSNPAAPVVQPNVTWTILGAIIKFYIICSICSTHCT